MKNFYSSYVIGIIFGLLLCLIFLLIYIIVSEGVEEKSIESYHIIIIKGQEKQLEILNKLYNEKM